MDRRARRLKVALEVGADAVINSAEEDVIARLIELQGAVTSQFGRSGFAGADIYIDAAGIPAVIETILKAAKPRAVLTIPAVHKKPIEIDFGAILMQKLDIRWAMGYPTEIFEVTDSIITNPHLYAKIISHTFPFDQALEAFELAKTPGAADKVVVLFD
ncbi:zinc-binding dehydrogenase [Timonella senegalensis]|uniref:zinc-binding dehydrogenase n=1 Tax=Timonella senegalensis TaxID=1465825 RepID=UPI0002FF10E1|nr:zinc-binding dehydrogenase [Timonella senegalensis]